MVSRDSTITIDGSVSATGEDSYAVLGASRSDQTLNILPNAQIVGRIDLGGSTDNDVVNVLTDERTASSTWTFENVETINLRTGDMSVVRSGGRVVLIDPTGSSAERIALGSATSQIRQLVFHRLADTLQSGAWGTFFGGGQERGDDGMAMAWSSNRFGAVGGYDIDLGGSYRVGLFAGGSRGHIETDIRSIETDTNSGFIGVYGQTGLWEEVALSGSVTVGYESHNSDRIVYDSIEGDETADGDYGSFYVNPSLALAWFHKLEGDFEFRPSAQVAYTYGRYNGYTESGTTNSNLRFDSRSVNIFDSRLQLALAQTFLDHAEIEVRGGATYTHYGDDSVGVKLDEGDLTSYRVQGEGTIYAGYLGARLSYAISDAINVVGDVEYQNGQIDTQSISGYLRLGVSF